MDMSHFIGQRFNLISKSDIRYVGTLHEINPEDSTIALENVVSHGTEGRRGNPAEEIPASSSVYEYIVFRGSDVKDISVVEQEPEEPEPPKVPNDPAILGSGTRPGPPQGPPRGQTQNFPQPPRQPPFGYPQQPPFPNYYGPYNQRFGPPGFPPGPGFPNVPYSGAPGWYPPGQGFQQPPGQFPPPPVPIGPPQPQAHQQRPGVPQLPGMPPNLAKPTSELPVGEKSGSKPASKSGTPVPSAPGQAVPAAAIAQKTSAPESGNVPLPASTSTQPVASAKPTPVSGEAATATKVPISESKSSRIVPAIPISQPTVKPAPAPTHAPNTAESAAQSSNQNAKASSAAMQEATKAATAAVAAAMAKLPQPAATKQQHEGAVEAVTKKVAEMKPYEGDRSHRGSYQGTRGGRGGHRGGYYHPHKKIEIPTTDYDFESANAKFNKQDLVKEAVASGSPRGEQEKELSNGAAEVPNGNGTPTNATANVYNKASSFFDNISSEIRDREEQSASKTSGREWRGEEEKRNIETFGQVSIDGYRGGYRGRGRGRGFGAPRGRGGYNRGYGGRGRGAFRGSRGASHATGIPTS